MNKNIAREREREREREKEKEKEKEKERERDFQGGLCYQHDLRMTKTTLLQYHCLNNKCIDQTHFKDYPKEMYLMQM